MNPRPALLALAAALLAAPASAQRTFDFSGAVPTGAAVKIYNFNGEVVTRAATGNAVRIHGVIENAGDEDVRFVSGRDGGDVRVCAVRPGQRCDAEGLHGSARDQGWHWGRNGSRARARFTVEVPRGVRLRLATGNGVLTVEGATDEVRAASGNGDIRVGAGAGEVNASSGNGDITIVHARGAVHASTGNGRIEVDADGPVNASSGNGRITVALSSFRGGGEMQLSSGNGTIDLAVPSGFSANVEATTGSGHIRADLPIQVTQSGRHRLSGRIGSGGPRLRLSTGTGTIILRNRGS